VKDIYGTTWWTAVRGGPPGNQGTGRWGSFWRRTKWPFVLTARRWREAWLLKRGKRPPRSWWRLNRWLPVGIYALFAILYVAWLIRAAYVVASGGEGWSWFWVRNIGSPRYQYSFDLISNVVLTILGGALAAVGWLFWRFNRVRWFYMRRARKHPDELVDAGSITGEVVGRDQLCDALMRDLVSRKDRRPHIVVGSMGLGKTALMVRLTERLARKRAVPVPVQLRQVAEPSELDFEKLARKQFYEEIQGHVLSAAEAEKVWLRLRKKNDRVVVLADGLEETLKNHAERDNYIRKALVRANDNDLPLVITSRPHRTLRGLDAAVTDLEPLSVEAAIEYISESRQPPADDTNVDLLVEVANATESPFYLQLARQLEQVNLLKDVLACRGDKLDAPADCDQWAVRHDLLKTWVDALTDGWLHPELPITPQERRVVIEYTSALACVGLLKDSGDVCFADLEGQHIEQPEELDDVWTWTTAIHKKLVTSVPDHRRGSPGIGMPQAQGVGVSAKLDKDAQSDGSRNALTVHTYDKVWEKLKKELESEDLKYVHFDLRVAAGWAARMGLVESCGDRVSFVHTVLQAYLGSRYFEDMIKESRGAAAAPLNKALSDPGREILMAMTLFSRSYDAQCECPGPCLIKTSSELLSHFACDALTSDAKTNTNDDAKTNGMDDPATWQSKALEMYGAALDVDCFDHVPQHRKLVKAVKEHWGDLQGSEHQRLEPFKKALIWRIGATAQFIEKRAKKEPGLKDTSGYVELFELGCEERSYTVRLAIAEAIGSGGDAAFEALEAKNYLSPSVVKNPAPGTAQLQKTPNGRQSGWRVTGERDRREAERKRQHTRWSEEREREEDARKAKERERWASTLRAWIIPMLVDSSTFGKGPGTPYDKLRTWVRAVSGDCADLALQLALAQGFKRAANHRQPCESAFVASPLIDECRTLMDASRFWFTRLTLLHALTLWAVDEKAREQHAGQDKQPMTGHGSSALKQMAEWLPPERDAAKHPLVDAGARLARRAIQTCRPDIFLWIDEAEVASQVGSESGPASTVRYHELWIAPWAGWSTLDPDARQLLADILILVALTDGLGDSITDRIHRLWRANQRQKNVLPLCLVKDRSALNPRRPAVVAAESSEPKCADGCAFQMCPYPSKGPNCRVEFSELFCINQHSLYDRYQPAAWLHGRVRRKARWQRHIPVSAMRWFWDEMADRARNRPLEKSPKQERG